MDNNHLTQEINSEKFKKEIHCLISKINNFIYLGSYEHPVIQSEEFEKLGIDVIINCTAAIDLLKFSSLNEEENKYIIEKIPIVDGDFNSFMEFMDKAVATIIKYLEKGKKIYIHCHKGISLAPAILIYYLMINKQFSYNKAFSLLKEKRPFIDINPRIENALKLVDEN